MHKATSCRPTRSVTCPCVTAASRPRKHKRPWAPYSAAPPRLRLGTQLARMETNESPMNLEIFAERMGAAPDAQPAYGIVINARGGF